MNSNLELSADPRVDIEEESKGAISGGPSHLNFPISLATYGPSK